MFRIVGDRKGTTKKLCDKDFAERSGELSGAICLKALVLLGNDRFFGFVSPFWLLILSQILGVAVRSAAQTYTYTA